jgi:hypothetical protein
VAAFSAPKSTRVRQAHLRLTIRPEAAAVLPLAQLPTFYLRQAPIQALRTEGLNAMLTQPKVNRTVKR